MIRFDGSYMKTLVSFTSSEIEIVINSTSHKQYSQTNLQQVGQINLSLYGVKNWFCVEVNATPLIKKNINF